MTDVRTLNCRAVATNAAGKVTGVELVVAERPGTAYELVRVELIDETAAQGNTVATCEVLDAHGISVGEPVYLAWPWPDLHEHALPGNQQGQHPITNGYTPPERGPLALYVGDVNGQPISDVIGGLGLPWNRHVSYRATWRVRGTVVPPDDELDNSSAVLLSQILATLERLAAHLGA